MTLDPVHFDGIARLASRIDQGVDAADYRAFAETVWQEFLDPLLFDGTRVLEPLDSVRRRAVDVENAALQADRFPTRHGLDSGTINPTTFRNGLVLDVAQAAMATVPSDLELHRARTVVATVHANDATLSLQDDWTVFDDGFSRGRILQAPRVDRYEQNVVHALALYLAESHHAGLQTDIVDDLLILDGPLYPKGLLDWAGRDPELADLLLEDQRPRDVVQNYIDLVESFVERDVPLMGFVKNPAARAVTRAVRAERGNAPWVDDASFFTTVLERRAGEERRTDQLTFTDWFVSRGGADAPLSTAGDALGLDRTLAPEQYEVTFAMVYDPRDDIVYRIEAPYAFTRDPDVREDLLMQTLKGVAAERGPPPAVAKADELARIGRDEKAALVAAIEERFDSERDTGYDERRWGSE